MTERMKRMRCMVLLLAILIFSRMDFAGGSQEIHLARMLYALGKTESDETLLMIGSALMNRLDESDDFFGVDEWIPWTDRFAYGMLYDKRCTSAAHALLMGTRTLPPSVVHFERTDKENPSLKKVPYTVSGNYAFYETGQ